MPSTPETAGRLWVVATPIGNLGDLSPRARAVLAAVDVVLCEDTRTARRLFSALGIPCPTLWRCDAHQEEQVAAGVLAQLQAGFGLALLSDAGTPCISDPGGRLVARVLAADLPVRVVPGPSALTAALSVCGLPAQPFHFLGFLPRKAGARREALRLAGGWPGSLVLLESGRRLPTLVAELRELFPDREAAICRELSKLHEEVLRGPLPALPEAPGEGEVVVVVGPGAAPAAPDTVQDPEGLGELAAALARRWGCARREAYQALLALEERRRPEDPPD